MVQEENHIHYAGPVAGHPIGVHETGGHRTLVTDGPKIISAKLSGAATLLVQFLADLLGRGQDPNYERQIWTFIGWLKQARLALANPHLYLPGQALVLAGPHDVGKNFLQIHILTPALGGRSGNPAQFLAGVTQFNESLIGCEHLLLADPEFDDKQRPKARDAIKGIVANERQALSPKFKAQVDLSPVRRLTISLNPSQASLSLFKPFDEPLQEKVILLKCYRPDGLPGENPAEREGFLQAVGRALPPFLGQVESIEIPQIYRGKGRFGIERFHHPDLRAMLTGSEPWFDLGRLIDTYLRTKSPSEIKGRAADLHGILKTEIGDRYAKLVSDGRELGRLLALLRDRGDGWKGRVRSDNRAGYDANRNYSNVWTISSS
jgi:hypothetical protein